MALHERAFETGGSPYGAVLFDASTKHPDMGSREVVDSAANKLRHRTVGLDRLNAATAVLAGLTGCLSGTLAWLVLARWINPTIKLASSLLRVKQFCR
jgi:hypothetical protein